MSSKFTSKAQTLIFLKDKLQSAKIPQSYVINRKSWGQSPLEIIEEINKSFNYPLIVRSSSKEEDTIEYSNAGKYLSIQGVEYVNLENSINNVFNSYYEEFNDDEVIIQPLVKNVEISGVAFSHDPTRNSPYRIINWTKSEDTTLVTSGKGGNSWIQIDSCQKTPENLMPIIKTIDELLEIFSGQPIDIEFAISNDGSQKILWLLQARKLIINEINNPINIKKQLNNIYNDLKKNFQSKVNILGGKTVFGVMPDWNPAEIIGIRPKPLSLSIYKELITDGIWAEQRFNYGYRDLRGQKLMQNFGGFPYIDVRKSFNSFIPNSLDKKIANSLVEYYVNKLIKNPHLHDKIEFEIVFSCFSFDIKDKLNNLKEYSFSDEDIYKIESSLKKLTNNIIQPNAEIWKNDLNRLEKLIKTRKNIFGSNSNHLTKIFNLIENTKNYGTLPFAGFARTSFIAVQFIQSMVNKGIFDKNDKESFYQNLSTITRRMVQDKKLLDKKNFLKKYGHLRPGTYDILSPRYDEDPDTYFDWNNTTFTNKSSRDSFKLNHEKMLKLEELIKVNSLNTEPIQFLEFLKRAIEYREYSKFEFTNNLSGILSLIKKWGSEFYLSEKDLAFLNIQDLKRICINNQNLEKKLIDSIKNGKDNYKNTLSIALPPIITSADDIYGFEQPKFQPSYITNKNAIGEVSSADSKNNLEGKIICIENADPGYDWIFDHKIAGFITAWGGSNSHMAIRSGELSIPAVIGVGELIYNKYSKSKKLNIDCLNQKVIIIA